MSPHFYPERKVRAVSLTWYGQAGFRLASGEAVILIDPFLTDRPDRRYRPPAAAADFADVTLVLCTHEHADHMDLPFLRELAQVNPAARVVLPAPVAAMAAAAGLDRERLIPASPGEVLTEPPALPGEAPTGQGITVHAVPAMHGIGGDEPVVYHFSPDGGTPRFLGYVVEIGGIRFYHSGDCLVYPELPAALAALAPDVLMLPINGRDHMRESAGIVGNMNETEAAWLCAQTGPAYVIPMHYDAIAGNTGDPGHFATLVRDSPTQATVLIPPKARPLTLTLP